MATLHFDEWRRWRSKLRRVRPVRPTWGASTALLFDWLLSTGICIGLAALLPSPAVPVVTAALLSLAGFVWLGVALTRADPPFGSGRLTAWDAALLSFAASFAVQSALRLGLIG